MNPIISIAALLLRPFVWLERLLTRDMKLQCRGGRIRLVDKEPVHSTRPPPAASAPRPDPSDDIELTMQTDLHQLITQHAQTRQLMRHLGYIEHTLRRRGADALGDIPLDVLTKGNEQLKSLVRDWSRVGLSELRSRLAVTIAAKENEAQKANGGNSDLSDFNTTSRLQVSEATPSDFQAVETAWTK